MSKTRKKNYTVEWIAGGVTAFVAALLLIAVIWVVKRVSFPSVESTRPTITTTQTPTTLPPAPPLIPNPYGPGDFSYSGGYLTCNAGESVLGVDVSEFQGRIDWDKVAASGVQIAMIRLGFRAWGEQGEILPDAYGLMNLRQAKQAGLQVGVYFFSQAITVEEAREEARFILQQLEGQSLDMPIVFDWETVPDPTARTANITAEKLNACAMAFCQEIRAAGYEPMVYFNPDLASRLLDLQLMQQQDFGFWLAMYTDVMTFPHRVDMWQYSSGGRVDGITGSVDLNLYFLYP